MMNVSQKLADLGRSARLTAFTRYQDICRLSDDELDDATVKELYGLRTTLGIDRDFDNDRLAVRTADDFQTVKNDTQAAYDAAKPNEHPLRQKRSQIAAALAAELAIVNKKWADEDAAAWTELQQIETLKGHADRARGLYDIHVGHNADLLNFGRWEFNRSLPSNQPSARRGTVNIGDFAGVSHGRAA